MKDYESPTIVYANVRRSLVASWNDTDIGATLC